MSPKINIHLWAIDFRQGYKDNSIGERRVFSINSIGTHAKE